MAERPKPLNLLIVEDVDAMRALMEHALEGLELAPPKGPRRLLKISCARSAVEARFELGRRRPDFVLLDEILPGESSVDLLHDLHQEGIPTVLLTGLENPNHALPPEAAGRLTKPGWKSVPQDRERFRQEIERVLGQTPGLTGT